MMVQALLPGCSTMQEATNHRDARRSKDPPPESDPSRQYVAPAPASFHVSMFCSSTLDCNTMQHTTRGAHCSAE